ncbi:MAG: hypothetical protein U1G07_17670 [Verrucomicrobiota bacterium]
MMNQQTGEYATIRGMADRYKVCEKTIRNWMEMGILIYFRVRRVIRFNITACDDSLRDHGYLE